MKYAATIGWFVPVSMILTANLGTLAEEDTAAQMRTWKSTIGTSIDAEFVKMAYGEVYLKIADGRSVKVPAGDLSQEDRSLAKQLSAANRAGPAKQLSSVVKPEKNNANAPKPPDALVSMFGDELVNAGREKLDLSKLAAADKIGIYFSAHWCPPCRAFTPQLVKTYNSLKKDGQSFEIVFISSDRSENGMYGYMTEMKMPWLALPYSSSQQEGKLAQKFAVRGIPRLVIIDANGKVLANDARGSVSTAGAAAYSTW